MNACLPVRTHCRGEEEDRVLAWQGAASFPRHASLHNYSAQTPEKVQRNPENGQMMHHRAGSSPLSNARASPSFRTHCRGEEDYWGLASQMEVRPGLDCRSSTHSYMQCRSRIHSMIFSIAYRNGPLCCEFSSSRGQPVTGCRRARGQDLSRRLCDFCAATNLRRRRMMARICQANKMPSATDSTYHRARTICSVLGERDFQHSDLSSLCHQLA